MTYPSGSTSFVGRGSAVAVSMPLSVFKKKQRTGCSTSRHRPAHQVHTVAQPAAQLSERELFEEMFVASRAKFVAIAHSVLRNREDAEDAVQNAFLSGFLHLRSFQGRSALRTWFTRIVLNAALMLQRKRRLSATRPQLESQDSIAFNYMENIPAEEPDPEMVHAEQEILLVVDRILEKMKPLLRQAFTMTYFDELSGTEACALLGVSVGTFKARLFRARRELLDQTERALVPPIHRTTLRPPRSLRRK